MKHSPASGTSPRSWSSVAVDDRRLACRRVATGRDRWADLLPVTGGMACESAEAALLLGTAIWR